MEIYPPSAIGLVYLSIGLLVREFCCSGTDVSAKVLAMYAGTRTPSMEPQWLAAGLSQNYTKIRKGSQ